MIKQKWQRTKFRAFLWMWYKKSFIKCLCPSPPNSLIFLSFFLSLFFYLKDFISPTLPFILLVSAMGSCFPVRHIEKGAMRVKEGLKKQNKANRWRIWDRSYLSQGLTREIHPHRSLSSYIGESEVYMSYMRKIEYQEH